MVEVELTHMVAIGIAIIAYIAGRVEILGRCLRELKIEFGVHSGISKQHHKDHCSKSAIGKQ